MIRPEDHEHIVEALRTFCPQCQVPYGEYVCRHPKPADMAAATEEAARELVSRYGLDGARFKLLASLNGIAADEERKQRLRNAQHALRYRAEARA